MQSQQTMLRTVALLAILFTVRGMEFATAHGFYDKSTEKYLEKKKELQANKADMTKQLAREKDELQAVLRNIVMLRLGGYMEGYLHEQYSIVVNHLVALQEAKRDRSKAVLSMIEAQTQKLDLRIRMQLARNALRVVTQHFDNISLPTVSREVRDAVVGGTNELQSELDSINEQIEDHLKHTVRLAKSEVDRLQAGVQQGCGVKGACPEMIKAFATTLLSPLEASL